MGNFDQVAIITGGAKGIGEGCARVSAEPVGASRFATWT